MPPNLTPYSVLSVRTVRGGTYPLPTHTLTLFYGRSPPSHILCRLRSYPLQHFRSPSEAHSTTPSLRRSHLPPLSERELYGVYSHFLIGLVPFYTIPLTLSIVKNKKQQFFVQKAVFFRCKSDNATAAEGQIFPNSPSCTTGRQHRCHILSQQGLLACKDKGQIGEVFLGDFISKTQQRHD